MALEPEQIERVREIIRYKSYSATETLLLALNATQEAETLGDLSEWVELRSKFVDIDSTVKIVAARSRLVIRNRLRERLGLEPLSFSSEVGSASEGVERAYSKAAPVQFGF